MHVAPAAAAARDGGPRPRRLCHARAASRPLPRRSEDEAHELEAAFVAICDGSLGGLSLRDFTAKMMANSDV